MKRIGSSIFVMVGACSLVLGCVGDQDDEQANYGASQYSIDTALRRPSEDALRTVSASIEAFAGYYCEHGALHVRVAGSITSATEASVQTLVPQSIVDSCYSRLLPAAGKPVIRLEQAKYNFLSLRTWRDTLTNTIFEIEGVNSLWIDYKNNVLVVGAESTAEPILSGVLASMGVPTDAYRVAAETRAVPEYACNPGDNGPTVQNCFRPVPAGVKFSPTASGGSGTSLPCTFGASVYRWMAELGSPYWQMGYVTASHCVLPMLAVNGNWIHQPNNDPQQFIAFEYVDPPGWVCGSYRCRYSDAAWLWSYGNEGHHQKIARTLSWNYNLTIDTTTPRFNITGSRASVQGMDVEKVGQTTGWTYGQVSGVCTDEFSATGPKMICQDRASYGSDAGDSGAPTFFWKLSDGPSSVDLVGIHWGATPSYRVYSPWAGVAGELGSMF